VTALCRPWWGGTRKKDGTWKRETMETIMSEKKTLLDALNRLIPSQFEEVLFNYDIPAQNVPPGAQTERAMMVIRYAEGRNEFAQLRQAIEEVAGQAFLPATQVHAPTANPPVTSSNSAASSNHSQSGVNTMPSPLKLFYSYSHADEDLRDKLAKHLKILQRQKIIDEWHDRAIDAGEEWEAEIVREMEEAHIILLLVSSDFIASDYCWGKELEAALEKHERREAKIIPVILRPVDWKDAPFSKLQALPKNAKAITTWDNIDEAMQNVAQGIRRTAESFKTP
jgi:hypothetical protein